MRPAAAIVVAALTIGVALIGCSSTARTPTVARTDFAPRVHLDLGCPHADSCPPQAAIIDLHVAGSGDTPVHSVPDGSVMVVTNRSTQPQRVTGTVKDVTTFDTGQMVTGNATTVVLDTPGVVTITDTTTGGHARLTVRPAPRTTG